MSCIRYLNISARVHSAVSAGELLSPDTASATDGGVLFMFSPGGVERLHQTRCSDAAVPLKRYTCRHGLILVLLISMWEDG